MSWCRKFAEELHRTTEERGDKQTEGFFGAADDGPVNMGKIHRGQAREYGVAMLPRAIKVPPEPRTLSHADKPISGDLEPRGSYYVGPGFNVSNTRPMIGFRMRLTNQLTYFPQSPTAFWCFEAWP